jgi:Asp-tRNA(Asn)/Glu-tRNA(Gln) amidotransferase C subunit
MKRQITLTTAFLLILGTVMAQQSNFEKTMMEALNQLDKAKSTTELQDVSGKFERIARVETERWEPYYYHAMILINLSFSEKDRERKDALLDDAQKGIDKALECNGNKSELHALQGFLYQGRLQVSPARAANYSRKAAEILGQAVGEDPANPRALYLLGMNLYYTPKAFGGGASAALPKFMEAKKMFEMQQEQVNSELLPKWGAEMNQGMIDACNRQNN